MKYNLLFIAPTHYIWTIQHAMAFPNLWSDNWTISYVYLWISFSFRVHISWSCIYFWEGNSILWLILAVLVYFVMVWCSIYFDIHLQGNQTKNNLD